MRRRTQEEIFSPDKGDYYLYRATMIVFYSNDRFIPYLNASDDLSILASDQLLIRIFGVCVQTVECRKFGLRFCYTVTSLIRL